MTMTDNRSTFFAELCFAPSCTNCWHQYPSLWSVSWWWLCIL